jgi:hypothetical protein
MTFLYDDWSFLLYRRQWDPAAFLDPHNQHIVLAPVAIYKLLLGAFGMKSAWPFQLAGDLFLLLNGALLFAYARHRVGDWLALMGAALLLFFGAAWQDVLWSFQMGLSGSIAAGLGALLALDRDDRLGDRIACGLLAVSVAFSEVGVAFAAGAMVHVALGDRPRARRLYLAIVPLLLYAAWWLGWGHQYDTTFSLRNAVGSPGYVLDAVSQAVAALTGLGTPSAGDASALVGIEWGRILLAVATCLAVVRLRRLGGVPRGVWVALAVGGAFWFLAAFNQTVFRPPDGHRTLYPGGVFVLLIAAELLRVVRLGGRAVLVAGALTAAAVGSNLAALEGGYRYYKGASAAERADLAALEMTSEANPSFVLGLDVSGIWLVPIETASYVSAVSAYGSPAYTEAELVASPPPARAEADKVFAAALGIRLTALSEPIDAGGGTSCRTVPASSGGETGIELGPGQVTLIPARARARAQVVLRRYADEFSVIGLGVVRSGAAATFAIPGDLSARPWHLGLRGSGPVTVCRDPA